jgi:hypothetical protein
MRPELDRGPGGVAVVWHIAAAKDAAMLCGTLVPATATIAHWQRHPERPCAPCKDAYRQLLLHTPAHGAQPRDRAHPTG